MPTMLRHKPTGDLYIFTEVLSRRRDMEFVDIPDIKPEPKVAEKPRVKRAKVEAVTEPVVVEEENEPIIADSIIAAMFPEG